MKRFAYIVLLLLAVAGVAGCNPAADFSVVEAGPPTLNGLSSVHGRATVENRGKRELVVESALFTVKYRGREMGTARLLLPIEIGAESVSRVRYDLALEGVSLATLPTLQTRLVTTPDAFTLDATGYVKWGGWRKKIEITDMTLTGVIDIIYNFAP